MSEPIPNGIRLLIVEDDPDQLGPLSRFMNSVGFVSTTASTGEKAMRLLGRRSFDVMICDLGLPDFDGFHVVKFARQAAPRMTILILTAEDSANSGWQARELGADSYVVKPESPQIILRKLLDAIEDHEVAERRAERESTVADLRGMHLAVNALEAKDPYTKRHSIKVAQVAVTMARRLPDMTAKLLRTIRYGALLHDVGKIGIPIEILHKNGPLSQEEWTIIKQHPQIGARILQPLAHRFADVQSIVHREHERWDGRGYPDGLEGEEIPIGARLVMIADTYDAICSTRPYRKARSKGEALDVIRRGAGKQFDPNLVPIFEQILNQLPGPRE